MKTPYRAFITALRKRLAFALYPEIKSARMNRMEMLQDRAKFKLGDSSRLNTKIANLEADNRSLGILNDRLRSDLEAYQIHHVEQKQAYQDAICNPDTWPVIGGNNGKD